jgi:hypothetical protein
LISAHDGTSFYQSGIIARQHHNIRLAHPGIFDVKEPASDFFDPAIFVVRWRAVNRFEFFGLLLGVSQPASGLLWAFYGSWR